MNKTLLKSTLFLLLAGALAAPVFAGLAPSPEPQPLCSVVVDHELMITDLDVVEDCARTTWGPCPMEVPPEVQGAWTFGKLVEGLAGTQDPEKLSKFVTDWLLLWEEDQTNINTFTVPARPSMKTTILDPWLAASGGKILDMKLAPFRLLAIVSRLDLRSNPGYDGGGSAGEGRFVFGFLSAGGNQLRGTVIFEYQLKSDGCEETKKWAERWHQLGTFKGFGEAYNKALQDITNDFAGFNADPSRPNGSGINHVRTNEFFNAFPWELREFVLDSRPMEMAGPSPLMEVTIKQTPEGNTDGVNVNWNGSALLADYINEFEGAIVGGTYVVPEIYQGENFLGAAARYNAGPSGTFWDAPGIINNEARHQFSKGTCSGCHARETDTIFTQIDPRPAGVEATISGYLSGLDSNGDPFVVEDPVTGEERPFHQLKVRAKDLCKLLNMTCKELAEEVPKSQVH